MRVYVGMPSFLNPLESDRGGCVEILYYSKRKTMPCGSTNYVTDYKLEEGVVYCKRPGEVKWRESLFGPKGLQDAEMFTLKFIESLENK